MPIQRCPNCLNHDGCRQNAAAVPSLRSLASCCGGVRLFGCLSLLVSLHVSLACGVRLSGYLSSVVSQPGWCRPALWISVFTCLPPFVSLSGWWCPALRDVCLDLSPFICLPVWLVVSPAPDVFLYSLLASSYFSPCVLGVSGSPGVFSMF